MTLLKNQWLLGVAVLLLLSMAACGDNDSDTGASGDNDSETESNEPVTLSLLVGNQTVLDGIEAVAAEIEELYNIKTDIELRPGGSEGDNLVKTRLATGDMTDLLAYNSGSLFKALNPEEYFVDLSGEEFTHNLEDVYTEAVSVGDAIYGIPSTSAAAGGLLYNRAVYEELGLEVPTTWDEFLENNDIISEAGITPVIASYRDTWTSQLLFLADYYNIHSVDPDFANNFTNNEAKIADTPLALRSFEKLQELLQRGHFNNEQSSTGYEDALAMLANGEAAHYPMHTFPLAEIRNTFPDEIENIGFFGLPGDDPDNHGITLWLPDGIYVNKDSEHAEEAKQWIEYFVSEEGLTTYMSVMQADGPYMVSGVDLPEDSYEAVKEMVPYIDEGKAAPALEFISPLKGPNLEQITVEVGLGMVTPEEAATNYDRDVERQAQQLNLEGWE
ncbi:ABC transporter substrate-binding protein [Alkalihalobacillus hemicellulosilyticus]|uniref:Rhamnose oligosaccharide ABC transport system n=1 Tax=Halalkalibacter hemicellulosilyticusJCM 9152 TaxID=1236971 RepID=W4Q9Y4_9BACI|nr:extracellular solute-binding protein [Halalkalibacter hemicellulosilyticus]GAE28820.1 rhamnose oligosaccharide ABC transport system [Halalkalibacter hemicellulosilyticusJCM 9152]